MNFAKQHILLKEDNVARAEAHFNARFVCETCLKDRSGNWINQPFALFYTEVAHPQGSNYFALYYNRDMEVMITDGITATEGTFQGVLATDSLVYHSRYRHDFRNIPGGFVDGGRDYLRYGGADMSVLKVVELQIKDGKLQEVIQGSSNTVIYLEDHSHA